MKRLLITLGCSHTEGQGCYGGSNKDLHNYYMYWDNFHKYGYPPQLAELLNYDRVINLGSRGYSASACLVKFFTLFKNESFKDYEVLVYWYVPHFGRFGMFENSCFTNHHPKDNTDISECYYNYSAKNRMDYDDFLEVQYLLGYLGEICKNKNWKLLASPQDNVYNSFINKIKFDTFRFNEEYWFILPKRWFEFERHKVDGHMNEKGYKDFSYMLFKEIKTRKPELLGNSSSPLISEWIGTTRVNSDRIEYFNEKRG